MGRPSDYGPEIADTICDRLSVGETLREVCLDEAMPGFTTVKRWLRKHDEFRAQYARACEDRADTWGEEIAEIADNGSNDWMQRNGKDDEPSWSLNGEHVQRSRLRVDARKWLMSKAAPKKYGDKVEHEHAGPGGGPIEVAVTDLDRAKALASLIARTKATHNGG